jgi:hypothetical protein
MIFTPRAAGRLCMGDVRPQCHDGPQNRDELSPPHWTLICTQRALRNCCTAMEPRQRGQFGVTMTHPERLANTAEAPQVPDTVFAARYISL